MIKVTEQHPQSALSLDLTPLLDIIFIVMVFLMLTAAVKLESLDITLPMADNVSVSDVDQAAITVNVLREAPYWAINGKKYIDWENFTLALLEEHSANKKPIIIGAEKNAEIQSLVQLLSFLQKNGIEATQLLTESSETD
ncbi:biopolymer transporter ExbD [Vibrio azureus]|uniref:Biopolymer transporter ExbD n=1 Tax=Vibrio azureus NBRC 104587 TaxID=1219077 RepID=U3BZS2_9VIBR|nr:biopolymer transporter ExbD [Vibrio azureus]AUI87825.1 biopolymer transporter ExbD [Vibrio azureus]GAD74784.1 hypothetical protein VAZ01S_015_00280 [Vibrio azureus NBRC 104587]